LDLTGAEPVATCPICGGRVLQTATHYLCERSQADKKPCKFKTNRIIARQPLDLGQLHKLLTDGRTDLLTQFVSKRGHPFSARLVLGENHKITFDFPSRD
jgi:DNA topoisomerase-3